MPSLLLAFLGVVREAAAVELDSSAARIELIRRLSALVPRGRLRGRNRAGRPCEVEVAAYAHFPKLSRRYDRATGIDALPGDRPLYTWGDWKPAYRSAYAPGDAFSRISFRVAERLPGWWARTFVALHSNDDGVDSRTGMRRRFDGDLGPDGRFWLRMTDTHRLDPELWSVRHVRGQAVGSRPAWIEIARKDSPKALHGSPRLWSYQNLTYCRISSGS